MVTRHGANGSAFGGADASHKIGRRVGAIGGLQCESTDHFRVIRRRRSTEVGSRPAAGANATTRREVLMSICSLFASVTRRQHLFVRARATSNTGRTRVRDVV